MTGSRCSVSSLWIFILSLADMISDFTYFGELYRDDDVSDLVAYAVLAFAFFGLVAMLVGPPTRCGLLSGVFLEDVPMIIATTAIEAYYGGADVTLWSNEAKVSYLFSVFALQQKLMHAGFAPIRRYQEREDGESPRVTDVFLWSITIVSMALVVAWIAAAVIILLVPRD